MYYRLKVPVEKINFEQWKEIFNVLKEYDDLRYVIMRNQVVRRYSNAFSIFSFYVS